MYIFDLLPCFPWEGPPLPRFFGITWSQLQSQTGLSPSEDEYFNLKEIASQPQAAYENKEEWEISWSPEGLPTKIVVHRKAHRQ